LATDSFGSSATYPFFITVFPAPLNLETGLSQIQAAKAAGDASTLLSTVSILSTSSNTEQTSTNVIQQSLFDAVKRFSESQTNQSSAGDRVAVIQMGGLILSSTADYNASVFKQATRIISEAASSAFDAIFTTANSQEVAQLVSQLTTSTLSALDTASSASNSAAAAGDDSEAFSDHREIVNTLEDTMNVLSRALTRNDLPGQTGSEVASTNLHLKSSVFHAAEVGNRSMSFSSASSEDSSVSIRMPSQLVANDTELSGKDDNIIVSLYTSSDIFSRWSSFS